MVDTKGQSTNFSTDFFIGISHQRCSLEQAYKSTCASLQGKAAPFQPHGTKFDRRLAGKNISWADKAREGVPTDVIQALAMHDLQEKSVS